MKRLLTLLGLLGLASMSFSALAVDVILGEKAVDVPLPVGKEIIIKFPKMVDKLDPLDEDKTTPENLTSFLRPDGVLMLKANTSFGEARWIAHMVDGNVVVLDLNAAIGALNLEMITLIDPESLKNAKPVAPVQHPVKPVTALEEENNPNLPDFLKDGAAKTKNMASAAGGTRTVGFNDMVQYGFRHYVGPSRLIGDLQAEKVSISPFGVRHFVRMWGDRLSIKPLSQWKIDNKYVTVLLVNNLSNVPVEFDPRALRGRLRFAAALYPVIEPSGNINDQTLWAVVTELPFNQAIQ